MANKPSENEIIEVLAFEMYVWSEQDDRKTFLWQQDSELRQQYRQQAQSLRRLLEESGLSVRVSSTPKVRNAVKRLMTRPEQKVYSLDSEKEIKIPAN